MYEIKTQCYFCEGEFEAIFEQDGECPYCHEKYTWQPDCDYEGAVLIVEWDNYDMRKPELRGSKKQTMEEKKYYTPTFDEFHSGFEFELLAESGKMLGGEIPNREWEKHILEDGDFLSGFSSCGDTDSFINRIFYLLEENRIRVKYLDKEDIESLEWGPELSKVEITPPFHYWMQKGDTWYRLTVHSDEEISIWSARNKNDLNCLFRGTIKNKSRLSLVMQMVGII